MSPEIVAVQPAHAEVLEALHKRCFETAWSAEVFTNLLNTPRTYGFPSLTENTPNGFILLRSAAGEGEILIIGTDPAARRQGLATHLLTAGEIEAKERGSEKLFLEVADDNRAAIAFYRRNGFKKTGLRPKYYKRADGSRADALIMNKIL